MDKIISKIAAMGVPALILIAAMDATGFAGAVALTAGLAAIGPGGMIPGLAILGIAGLVSQAIAEFGVDAVYTGVVNDLYKRGYTREAIMEKIDKYPVSPDLKRKLKDHLSKI